MRNTKAELVKDIYAKVSRQSDLDWSEIAQRHEVDVSSETIRKAGFGVKLVAEAGMLNLDGDSTARDYEEDYKERRKFFDQRKEYNALITADARREHLEEVIRDSARIVAAEKPLYFSPIPLAYNVGENDAVLVLTDWHYGLVTDNVWNKYDVATCRKRVAYVVEKSGDIMKRNNVRNLYIVILGDMASGAIHTSCRVASEENTVDQLIHVSELLAESIAELSGYAERVYVFSTYGNHMRTVPSIKDSIHRDNMERIIPWWLSERFNGGCNENVKVMECDSDEFIRFSVCGYNVLAVHGDLDTDKNAPIRLNTLHEKLYGKGIDYLLTAHMHHGEGCEMMGIEHIQTGCLCGADEYAKNKRLYSLPSQTLMIFNRDVGLDTICNIKLDNKRTKDRSRL